MAAVFFPSFCKRTAALSSKRRFSLGSSHSHERTSRIHHTDLTMALFMGLSRAHIRTCNSDIHNWIQSDGWTSSYIYRGKIFHVAAQQGESPESFSKIGHDDAGYRYLGTSTINVKNFSVGYFFLLCSETCSFNLQEL